MKHSEEARKRIFTEEHRKNLSLAHKGNRCTEETRKKTS